MKRVGKCNRCGKCCVEAWRFVYTAMLDADHNVEPGTLKLDGYPRTRTRPLEEMIPCKELSFKDGVAICNKQDCKSYICANWPFFPEELIFDGCGFSFVEEDDKDAR
jgi:Fe-S-cluster containining protein